MTADTTVSIPAIFDLKQKEVLWIDLNLTRNIAWGGANNVEANQKGMVLNGINWQNHDNYAQTDLRAFV